MIKYAIKRDLTNKYLVVGGGPGLDDADEAELTVRHLYMSMDAAVNNISWMREYAKTPDKGPKVRIASGETFQIVQFEVTCRPVLTVATATFD